MAPADDPLNLPGERVLWHGGPVGSRLGKDFVAEQVLSGCCLLAGALAAVGVIVTYVANRMDWSPKADESTIGITVLLAALIGMIAYVVRDFSETRRAASVARRTRYLVTTRRLLVARPDDMGDTIVEIERLAADCCHASSHGVHFTGPDGAVKIAFDRLPDPVAARDAIVTALAAAREAR